MIYVTSRCPHCNKALSVMRPKNERNYGSPFRTCPHCQRTYVDKSYQEIAVSGAPTVYRIPPGCTIMFLFLLIALLIVLTEYKSDSFLPVCGCVFMLIITAIPMIDDWKTYEERKGFVFLETLRSESRLSNPEYAAALQRIGYSVPEQYLFPVKSTDERPTEEMEEPMDQKQESISSDENPSQAYYIETPDGMTIRVPADKLDAWLAADHNAPLTPAEEQLKERILTKLYGSSPTENKPQSTPPSIAPSQTKSVTPYAPDTYAQAVRDKLNAEPYDPSYHNRARNPYTQRIITCEADYEEYVREFVCEMLLAEKYKANAEQATQIGQTEQNHREASAETEKPIGYIPNSSRIPTPWWRIRKTIARLAICLISAMLVCAIAYAIVQNIREPSSSGSSVASPPTVSVTPTLRPSPSPIPSSAQNAADNLPDPLPVPDSGEILFEQPYLDERIAPLTIDASGQSSFTGFYVKLRSSTTKVPALAFYVKGGTTAKLAVPLGTYQLLYASGYSYSWYGQDLLFGPNTSYYLADNLFNFYEEDGYVNGWTVTLDKQYNGNLDIDEISAAEFG